MADVIYKKISELDEITELSENSYFPVVDNGIAKKVAANAVGSSDNIFIVNFTGYKDSSIRTDQYSGSINIAVNEGKYVIGVWRPYSGSSQIEYFNLVTCGVTEFIHINFIPEASMFQMEKISVNGNTCTYQVTDFTSGGSVEGE